MPQSGASWFTIVPAAIAAVAPAPACATVYMSVEQAAHAMFAGAKMVDRSITFTDAQRKAIAKASRASVPKTQHVWEVREGSSRVGWFIVDRVLGKHDQFIADRAAQRSRNEDRRPCVCREHSSHPQRGGPADCGRAPASVSDRV